MFNNQCTPADNDNTLNSFFETPNEVVFFVAEIIASGIGKIIKSPSMSKAQGHNGMLIRMITFCETSMRGPLSETNLGLLQHLRWSTL